MDAELKTGKIVGLSGIAGAGLLTLEFEDAYAFIESGFGVRALVACFGSLENIQGQEIVYEVDTLNVLVAFNLVP